MHRTFRNRKGNTKRELEPAHVVPFVYPTPTSLESHLSPYAPVKSFITIPPSTLPPFYNGEGTVVVGEEGTTSCLLPLLIGHVQRKTSVTSNSINTTRRLRKRRCIDSVEMEKVRNLERQNSFSSSFNSEAGGGGLGGGGGVDFDFEASKILQANFLGDITRTSFLKELCGRLGVEGSFDDINVSEGTRIELGTSLATVFLPVCMRYNASLDTAFLAYGIILKYSKIMIPRLATTRNQLYVSALVISFKYSEEEDPNITDFGKTICKSKWVPNTFIPPSTLAVLRMEQKMMKTIRWRISDIVTPMVLTYALLDCFPRMTSAKLKRTLAKRTELFLQAMLTTNAILQLKFSVAKCSVFALSYVIISFDNSIEIYQCARLLWRLLYPNEWVEPSQVPDWLDTLKTKCLGSTLLEHYSFDSK